MTNKLFFIKMVKELNKEFIVNKLDESKVENITVLDVKEKTSLMDYMIIGTGLNERHLEATADHLREFIKQNFDFVPKPVQGKSSGWVILDLNEIFVNLFTAEERSRYDLETLWKNINNKE